ncbi:uncharacterized protein LOC122842759 [Gambusia affinis]|uniref:uncharacterized protein LOC122842759 n=1 Tax=Gambusia affinis TaxID=33528 RepID=UPI001CDC1F30|nr:uncharacterized protein LOC122842759 [Gambusia affinis]
MAAAEVDAEGDALNPCTARVNWTWKERPRKQILRWASDACPTLSVNGGETRSDWTTRQLQKRSSVCQWWGSFCLAMDSSHCCAGCGAALQADDGHDLCPACLGHDHLAEALSDNPCMNCSYMPHAVKVARLAQLRPMCGTDLPPSGQVATPRRSKRRTETASSVAPPKKRRARSDQGLSTRVERLSAELAEMKSLFQAPQAGAPMTGFSSPPMPELAVEEDVLSLAASASHFGNEEEEEARSPRTSETGSRSSSQSAASGSGDGSMQDIMLMALRQLQLDVPQVVESAPGSAFFRRGRAPAPFSVPPSGEYLRELHACWRDPRAFSRLSADGRVLAAMHDSVQSGLDRMPAVEPAVASLIVSPDEALREDVRCPRAQCRITDGFLCKAYNAGARAGRLGNSLAHLMFALSASLQDTGGADAAVGFSDAALQAFALMTRELGRLMSFLVQARRQGSYSGLLLWKRCSERFRRGRLDNSSQASAEVCPLLLMIRGAHRLAPAFGRLGVVIGLVGFTLVWYSRDPAGTFVCARHTQPGPPGLQTLAAAPPGPLRVVGREGDAARPAVGCFSHQQLGCWAALAVDPWVVATLTHGYRLQFRRRPHISHRVRVTVITDPVRAQALDQELSALLAKGAIEAVDPLRHPGGYYSTYFLVPKKTGGFRPILDLRGLNQYLKVLPFHMLTTAEVLRAVARGEWFTSIDLMDAYFHVPVAAEHRRFLRFAYQGRHWQFCVLPFGLSLSPRVFTRCVRAALSPLQARGMKVLPYLDDWLLCAPSREDACRDTSRLLAHVSRLGLKVNLEKSCLIPSQTTTFLGVLLDSPSMTAYPSVQRVDDILQLVSQFRLGRQLPYVAFLRLLGKLTSVTRVVPLGLLSLRPLQRWINSWHLDAKLHRNRKLVVTWPCLHALTPWRDRAYLSRGVSMGVVVCRREVITTDASSTGWGAVWQHRAVQGRWGPLDRSKHINVLELRAVHLALRHFLPHLEGRHVLIRSDNTSVVYHINHQGGTRSAQLLQESRDLLNWATVHLCTLRAVYLPGLCNGVADSLSRRAPAPGEWSLHSDVVSLIWDLFGQAEVDLFATEESTHCPLWFSLTGAAGALGQDALAHPWPRVLLYAFPPLSLIWPTLQRVLEEGHRMLLVAPYWPAQPWFPLLWNLCHGVPWCLPTRRDLLSQLGGQIWHPDPRRLRLWVWPLGGSNSS